MRKITDVIKLLLAGLFFYLALQCSLQAERSSEIITVLLDLGGLSASEAEKICQAEAEQEDSQYVCFWGEERETTLSCRETGGSAQVTMILTQGNPELVVPGTEAVVWQEKGCYIDTETAKDLFGRTEAAGQLVWWNDHAYTVCGTFESLRKTMVRCAGAEDGQAMTGVSLRLPQKGNRKGEAEQFLMRNGLSGKQTDVIFLNALTRDLLLLAPLILVFRLVWSLLRPGHLGKKTMEEPLSKLHPVERSAAISGKMRRDVPRFLLAGLLLGGALWMTLVWIEIPADMIPTKWSDFTFWSGWWKGQRQNMLLLMETAQGERQLDTLWRMARSLLYNMLSIFLLLLCHPAGD